MSFFGIAAFPSGMQSGLMGMASASASMAMAAQEIAEAGTQGMEGYVVSLGEEARLDDGLIGLVTADAVYTANANVVRLSDGLFQDLMGTPDDPA